MGPLPTDIQTKRMDHGRLLHDRPHEDKINFSLVYRTLFVDTTCEKLNFGHAFL